LKAQWFSLQKEIIQRVQVRKRSEFKKKKISCSKDNKLRTRKTKKNNKAISVHIKMFSGFFKKSDKNKPHLGDLEEKENCPFLMEADGRKPKV